MGDTPTFIDIGANLTDEMYQGVYHSKKYHEADLNDVLSRSWDAGVEKIIITAGSLSEAKSSADLAKIDERMFFTVGVHPTRCDEFLLSGDPDLYMNELLELIKANREQVVAIGEFGLDYDRTKFCAPGTQRRFFAEQFLLARETKLPLFLHMREAGADFVEIVEKHQSDFQHGVVHSFTGTAAEASSLLDMGLFIGLNGCSLKTAENIEVVKGIPLDRIMIETDAPWCDMRPSHASAPFVSTPRRPGKDKKKWTPGHLVKGRNEPCTLSHVLEVVAAVHDVPFAQAAAVVHRSTTSVFFPLS